MSRDYVFRMRGLLNVTRLTVVLRHMINEKRPKFMLGNKLGLALTTPTPPYDTYKLTLSRIGKFSERGRKLVYPSNVDLETVVLALLDVLPENAQSTVKIGEKYIATKEKNGEILNFGCIPVYWRLVPEQPKEAQQTAMFETSPIGNNYKE